MVADAGPRALGFVRLGEPAHRSHPGQSHIGERDIDTGALPVRSRLTNALETAETINVPVIRSQAGRTWLTGVLELFGPVISGTPTSALME